MDGIRSRVAAKKAASVCPLLKAGETMSAGASHRLRKDRQIRFVLEKGRLFRGQHLLLRALPSREIKPPPEGLGPFLAVVISRKKEKKAVARNRMKRQLREIFRLNQVEIPSGTAYVLIARNVGKKISYAELRQDFLNLTEKSKTNE